MLVVFTLVNGRRVAIDHFRIDLVTEGEGKCEISTGFEATKLTVRESFDEVLRRYQNACRRDADDDPPEPWEGDSWDQF